MAQQQNPQPNAAQAKANNRMIRQHVSRNSVEMTQLMQSFVLNTPNITLGNNIISFTPKNVGLLKRFYVEVNVSFTTPAGVTLTRTPFGPSNILSNITFTDFQNQSRINTTGWHLSIVNTIKAKASAPIASAETTDSPLGFGNNFAPLVAPATVAASTATTMKMIYEVPIAYSDDDLRGAIYMATTGATATLSLTINPSMFLASGADPTPGVYSQSATGTVVVNQIVVNVYQEYLDQLPLGPNNRVLLPEHDINTIYQLLNTNINGLLVNQPFGIPYTNLRSYMSTTLIYDNGGLNAGTDIQNIGLQSANNTYFWQMDPGLIAYRTRKMINSDVPLGTYYFDHRKAPISTAQFGNFQLTVLPSTVNAGAQCLLGYEFFAARATVRQAQSLPSG